MTILNLPGKIKEYTPGEGIEIDANNIISLLLAEAPNLLKINENGELYCNLQTATNPATTSTFEPGITTGYVLPSGGWPEEGQILMCKTLTGNHFCILRGDDGKLYYSADVSNINSRSHILRDDDIDSLLDILKQYIDDQLSELAGFVKVTSTLGVAESNNNMMKSIGITQDQDSVTLTFIRRDLSNRNRNDIVGSINFPIASTLQAGAMTSDIYNQIQNNTQRILHLEGLGEYLGVFPTFADRPTNISTFTAQGITPTPKDFIRIEEDINFNNNSSTYTILSINGSTGAITWDDGMGGARFGDYRIYQTLAERNEDINVYSGLRGYVVATDTFYTYKVNQRIADDPIITDYDDLDNIPIINTSASVDTLVGEDGKTLVYNLGDGDRYIIERNEDEISQIIQRVNGYSIRLSHNGGTTWGERVEHSFNVEDKWEKVIISQTEPSTKSITTPRLDTTNETLKIWNGVRWIVVKPLIEDIPILPTFNGTMNGTEVTLSNVNADQGDGALLISITSGTKQGDWEFTTDDGEITVTSTETESNVGFKYIIVKENGLPYSTQAENILFDNTGTGLTATDVQDAIEEVATKVAYPQRVSLPTASAEEVGQIYQYVGATTATLTNGFFYKCESDGQDPATYSRENIDVQIAKTTLVDLEDTNITNPQDGQVVKYDGTTHKFINAEDKGGIQYNPNSPYKPGFFRVGTQAQYDALSQYYTTQENDTIYFTI